MNAREMKNTRKRTVALLTALEAQAKKLDATIKAAKAHLKEVDALIADNAKLATAAKAPKAAKKTEKPAKAAKAKKVETKPAKAVKAKAVKPAKAVKAKAEKPAKAAKAEKPAKGERPTLVEAIKIVMGNKTMNAEAVLAALTEKGWAPGAQDKKTYTSYLLSSNKDIFGRVPEKGRGFYCVLDQVKAPAKAEAPKAEKKAEASKAEAEAPKAEAKAEAPKAEKKPAKDKTADDKILADLGVKSPDAANPFG